MSIKNNDTSLSECMVRIKLQVHCNKRLSGSSKELDILTPWIFLDQVHWK